MKLMLRDIFFFLSYQTLYLIVALLQTGWWVLSGIRHRLQRIKSGKDYETSAQVLGVVLNPDAQIVDSEYPVKLIATHQSFQHPRCVLKANVSLHSVTEDEAVFVEVAEEENVYDTQRYPFLFTAQMTSAVRMIRVPLSTLIRLADELGDLEADKQVLFVHHIGRCGGTLLMQMFNRLSGSVCMSEPHGSLNLTPFKGLVSISEYRDLLRSVFRIICKVDASIICIKTFNINWLSMVKDLNAVFPRFQHLLMYRGPLPHLKSRLMSWSVMYSSEMQYFVQKYPFLSKLLGFKRKKVLQQVYGEEFESAFDSISKDLLELNRVESYCLQTALWYREYMHLRQDGVKIDAARFEDLISDPHGTLRSILDKCKLSLYLGCIEDMVKAIKRDSQKGSTVFSWKRVKANPTAKISRESLSTFARFYQKLPELQTFSSDPWTLQGTLKVTDLNKAT